MTESVNRQGLLYSQAAPGLYVASGKDGYTGRSVFKNQEGNVSLVGDASNVQIDADRELITYVPFGAGDSITYKF